MLGFLEAQVLVIFLLVSSSSSFTAAFFYFYFFDRIVQFFCLDFYNERELRLQSWHPTPSISPQDLLKSRSPVPRSFRLGPIAGSPVAPVWMSKKRRDLPPRIIIS